MATPEPSTAPSAPDRPINSGQPGGSEAYRSQAGRYDRRTDAFRRWRELVVEQLPARPGDAVLDVGCGTGLCLPLLQHKVGPSGTIIGIDASAQMLEVAGARVTEHGWDNVHLLTAPIAEAPIERTADAALFCAVHDVLQNRDAVAHVFDHLRPGAAVAAIGGKWPPLERSAAGVGGRPARTVHYRLHRLRPAVAAAGRVRPRPEGDGAGLRRRIPGDRPRP